VKQTTTSSCGQPRSSEINMCLGLVAEQLFLSECRPIQRPSFAEFACSPTMRYKDLRNLGVDSLGWMALLTSLENRLGVRFKDDMFLASTLSAQDVARALAESLCRDRLNKKLAEEVLCTQNISSGERHFVIDDFLPLDQFNSLRMTMCDAKYELIDSVVNSVLDGAAYRSSGRMLTYDAHPTAGALGAAFGSILRAVRDAPEVFGQAGEDWSILSFAFWQYPVGTRLGWHNDAGERRSGEFILYLHDEWKPSWGGELVLLDHDTDALTFEEGADPFALVEAAVARARTQLTAIVPRSNRLVLVRAGTAHYINRVDTAAGDARRCSLTGFAAKRSANEYDAQSKLDRLGSLFGWQRHETSESSSPRTDANQRNRTSDHEIL
jgi:2OG-Fe(II) oxygenase superfamily/Phosphopantetheine attachment site